MRPRAASTSFSRARSAREHSQRPVGVHCLSGSKSSNPAPPLLTWLATSLPLPPQAVAVLRSKTLRSFTDITHATRTSRPNSQDETHRLPTVTPYPFRDLDITAFVKGTLVNPSLGDAPLSYVGILNFKALQKLTFSFHKN